MKRIVTTLLIAAFIVLAIVDAVHEFRSNETAKFYSSHPERLLYVLAIAVFGGVVAVLFYQLSPSGQRRAKLFALGNVRLS
jgi:H+/Cl- antiporter ClcA